MGKRQILVHDCGYIVQPGDVIVFQNNDTNRESRPYKIGMEVVFVRLVKGEFSDGYFVNYGVRDSCGEVVYIPEGKVFPGRFDCTVMEIDDACEN